jgi:hypothetical protein
MRRLCSVSHGNWAVVFLLVLNMWELLEPPQPSTAHLSIQKPKLAGDLGGT